MIEAATAIPLLEAVGMAEAAGDEFGLAQREALAKELDTSAGAWQFLGEQLDRAGLTLNASGEELDPPMLLNAGRQYLERKGEVEPEVLHFLPRSSTISIPARPCWSRERFSLTNSATRSSTDS
jgi:hypothetical protein